MAKLPSNQDLIEVINKSFSDIEQRMTNIETKMVTKDELKTEFSKFETRMVTKDYLDQKLFALKGELNTSIKKVDDRVSAVVNQVSAIANQVGTLVNVLRHKKVISPTDAQQVLVISPF